MSKVLHIVEPTLSDETGHCYSHVKSIVQANLSSANFDIHLWIDRRGKALAWPQNSCTIHPIFSRRFRKIQMFFCLRYLMRQKEKLLITTCGRLDMKYLDFLDRNLKKSTPLFLHFHQFKVTHSKKKFLEKIAIRHPQWVILAPTEPLLNIFRTPGFLHCELVPCTSFEPVEIVGDVNPKFEKVIYAGAARKDKGFPQVIHLIEYFLQHNLSIPMALQVSPPASGRYDEESQAAVKILQSLQPSFVTYYEQTLPQSMYQKQFLNSIALMLYDVNQYSDKFSGIVLDALCAGCPIITVPGTWIAEVVSQWGAGLVIKDREPPTIHAAIQQIRENYSFFHARAKEAKQALLQKHTPQHLLTLLEKYEILCSK